MVSSNWRGGEVLWSTASWASGTVPNSPPGALQTMLNGRIVKMWEGWWAGLVSALDNRDFDIRVGLRKISNFIMIDSPGAPRKA